jgi:hypothetical protein
MKYKHTKGPWTVAIDPNASVATLIGPFKKDHSIYTSGTIAAQAYGPTIGEAEQNAQLIAAAPEMLEVLERLEKHFAITAVGSLHNQQINDLRAAIDFIIKKARGES